MSEITWLQQWTELVSSADTVAEFGRKLVHSPITAPTAVGAHVFLLDGKGELSLAGGYGVNPFGNQKFAAWDDQVLSNAVRNRKLEHEEVEFEGAKLHCYVIAISKGDTPLGAALFTQREPAPVEYSAEANHAMSQVLGIWVQSLGLSGDWKPGVKVGSTDASPEDLTERQLTILELMSKGMTNAQIAQELILSESSIRQETVKIYRALGVGSRSEAAKRAVHLGILRAAAGGL